MSYLEKAQSLYAMMDQGQMMEAFEKYYAENVTVIEANGEVREGKEAQRKALEGWTASLQEMHGGATEAITANEEARVTMVESWADVTFKDGTRIKMEEIAVQHWEGEQIVKERFYYNAAGMPQG